MESRRKRRVPEHEAINRLTPQPTVTDEFTESPMLIYIGHTTVDGPAPSPPIQS